MYMYIFPTEMKSLTIECIILIIYIFILAILSIALVPIKIWFEHICIAT